MKNLKTASFMWGLLLLTAGPLCAKTAGGDGWTSDFEGAKTQARAEGKDLLLDFTGSDWCGWCIKLRKEVFDTEVFKDTIHDDFILVEVDFPRDQSLVTEEVRAQNAALQKEYSIPGYPTIFLTDAEGRPYAQTGYQQGGPEKYLEHLETFRKAKEERDGLLKRAEEAIGVERAKLLDQALEITEPGLIMPYYADLVDEIIELDADGEAGLKQKYSALLAQHEIQAVCAGLEQEFQKLANQGQWDEVIAHLEAAVLKHEGSNTVAHHAHFFKAIALLEKKEFDQALAALDASEQAEPEGRFVQVLPKIREAVEKQRAAPDDDTDDDGGDGGN